MSCTGQREVIIRAIHTAESRLGYNKTGCGYRPSPARVEGSPVIDPWSCGRSRRAQTRPTTCKHREPLAYRDPLGRIGSPLAVASRGVMAAARQARSEPEFNPGGARSGNHRAALGEAVVTDTPIESFHRVGIPQANGGFHIRTRPGGLSTCHLRKLGLAGRRAGRRHRSRASGPGAGPRAGSWHVQRLVIPLAVASAESAVAGTPTRTTGDVTFVRSSIAVPIASVPTSEFLPQKGIPRFHESGSTASHPCLAPSKSQGERSKQAKPEPETDPMSAPRRWPTP